MELPAPPKTHRITTKVGLKDLRIPVKLDLYEGMWHIFQTQGTFPESRQAMQRLAHFLRRHLAAVSGSVPSTASSA